MDISTSWLISMQISARLIQLRKQRKLSQQRFADAVGLHITQIRRYEAGYTQPSLEALKKIAITFGVSADFLLFDETERDPNEGLRLQFDVVSRLDLEEQRIIREFLDGMILKYQARRWAGNAPNAPILVKEENTAKQRKTRSVATR